MTSALVAFAVQADISIDVNEAKTCRDLHRAISGRMAIRAGLDRILAGTGCGYRQLDARAFQIVHQTAVKRVLVAEPADKSPQADELVIVATRRATPADRLAYSVSTVSGQWMRQQGLKDTADLAQLTPAMTVTNLGMGRNKIILRGLSDGPLTGHPQSMVGIYLDQTRLTFNAPNPDLRLVDMDRVEVLRGPQGTLYGAGSLGGVVHMITQPPDPAARLVKLESSFGITDGGTPSQSLDMVLNQPVLSGRGAVRAVVYREIQGGYIDDAKLGRDDLNRSKREGLRASGVLDISDHWSVTAGTVWQDINSADTQYALVNAGAYSRRNGVREPHDNDYTEAHLGLKGKLGWGDLQWSTALVRHSLFSRYDASNAPVLNMGGASVAFDDHDQINSLVTEATASASANSAAKAQWLVGAFFAQSWLINHSELTRLGPDQGLIFGQTRHDVLAEAAVYGEATVALGSGLSLTLGGRAFSTEVRTSGHTLGFGATRSDPFAGNLHHTGLVPKLVLAYSGWAPALVYVQAAEGYRPAGFNTSPDPSQILSVAGGSEPLRNYQKDELWSLETGAKFSMIDGRLAIRVALFEAFWRNIQSDQLLASGLSYTANIGNGQNLGLEFEGRYRHGPLILYGEFLYNSPELIRSNRAFGARSDFGLAVVPDLSVGAAAEYSWPLSVGRDLVLDGRVNYVGGSTLALAQSPAGKMGDYATGRLAMTLQTPRWSIGLAVNNPSGTKSNTFAYGNPFSLGQSGQVTPLRPRTVTMSVDAQF